MPRRFLKPKKNIALIDSQNLNLGTQRMGWKMDWRKFRKYLQNEYNVDKAYLFIGYLSENESLYEYMHDLGYLVVLKPTIQSTVKDDGSGNRDNKETKIKGNVDTEIVLYALKEIKNYSKAVIVSADGDFYGLIEYLAKNNKLLKVLTPGWQYSTLLKDFEKYIVNLSSLKRELAYKDFKKNKNIKS